MTVGHQKLDEVVTPAAAPDVFTAGANPHIPGTWCAGTDPANAFHQDCEEGPRAAVCF